MELCINAEQLRKALADIEAAEERGFMFCLAVFKMSAAGPSISDCRADYSDMIERAHPTDGKQDWGRFQSVSKRAQFIDGELVYDQPLE